VSEAPIPHWPGRLVPLGDHDVYVRGVPPGPGEPALCVHGLEGSSRNWTDLMELLRPRLACQAVDLPGFGNSPPRPDGKYSIAALAQTVTTLIGQLGHGPVHLIGNSLGGSVCVKIAARHPDLVRTLTLVSPALPDSRPRLDLLRFPVLSLPLVGTRLLRRFRVTAPEYRVADVIATCFSDPARFPPERFAVEVAELVRRDGLGYGEAVLVGSVRTLTAQNVHPRSAWREAALITAPSLVIFGSHDRLVDRRLAGRAAHAFAHARVVVLPRTGHLAHMEHPHAVAREIGLLIEMIGVASAQAPAEREFPLTPAG
jgi:pimeloyl-ACP methyl ester carboxylesterase